MVKESARYDNFMEKTQVKDDEYIATLDRHVEGDDLIVGTVIDTTQKEIKQKDGHTLIITGITFQFYVQTFDESFVMSVSKNLKMSCCFLHVL